MKAYSKGFINYFVMLSQKNEQTMIGFVGRIEEFFFRLLIYFSIKSGNFVTKLTGALSMLKLCVCYDCNLTVLVA